MQKEGGALSPWRRGKDIRLFPLKGAVSGTTVGGVGTGGRVDVAVWQRSRRRFQRPRVSYRERLVTDADVKGVVGGRRRGVHAHHGRVHWRAHHRVLSTGDRHAGAGALCRELQARSHLRNLCLRHRRPRSPLVAVMLQLLHVRHPVEGHSGDQVVAVAHASFAQSVQLLTHTAQLFLQRHKLLALLIAMADRFVPNLTCVRCVLQRGQRLVHVVVRGAHTGHEQRPGGAAKRIL
mmetsp:Transcript_5169/g.9402  ORF Transcript_5169/g.9402 Transcript_5169/m.9402 type:complete len:235 (+) Transcript_5169:1401-2105(+)